MGAAKKIEHSEINGYRLTDEIGRGARSVVYKAIKDGKPYAFKVTLPEAIEDRSKDFAQFRKEASMVSRFNCPSLVKIVDFGEADGSPYLVTELIEGETVNHKILSGVFEEQECLKLAFSVAESLAEIHRYQMVHRDIKPSNLMVDSKGNYFVIDLGLAGDADDIKIDYEQHEFVGTLLYAAPEQIGIIKTPADGRADLYSLGVTLYETLIGRPPFIGANLTEIVNQHATFSPPLIHDVRPTISRALSMIIQKLLSKDPDERYQTALSLSADLKAIDEFDLQLKNGQQIQLGKSDQSGARKVELPLMGREQEISRLSKIFESSLKGQGGFALIEGESGSGKTRLTREMIKRSQHKNLLVLRGKGNNLASSIPFAPLREAFDHFATSITREPEERKSKILQALKSATKGLESTVARLSMGLANLAEISSSRTEPDDAMTQQRFYEDVKKLIFGLATGFDCLVLAIDDIQWVDAVTLDILQTLAEDSKKHSVMLLATARNDQASQDQVGEFKKKAEKSIDLNLALNPLSRRAVNEIVKAQLGGLEVEEVVSEKLSVISNGNPFVINESVTSLLSTGNLYIRNGLWTLHEQGMAQLNLASDIFRLVLERTKKFPADFRAIVDCAAVVGVRFDSHLVQAGTGLSEDIVKRGLEYSQKHNIIESSDDGSYQFVHDRIREATYADIEEAELIRFNDKLADYLEQIRNRNSGEVFLLARLTAQGNVVKNPQRAFQAAVAAGQLALSSFTYEIAVNFFHSAVSVCDAAQVTNQDKYQVFVGLGTACLQIGRLTEAHEALGQAHHLASDKMKQGEVLYLQMRTFSSEGDNESAWKKLIESMSVLGEYYPARDSINFIFTIYYFISFLVLRSTSWGFGKLSKKSSAQTVKRVQLVCLICENGQGVAFFRARTLDMMQLIFRHLYYSHFLGECADTAKAYITASVAWDLMGFRKAAKNYRDRAFEVADQLKNPAAKAYVRSYSAWGLAFGGDTLQSERVSLEAYPDALKYLGTQEISRLAMDIGYQYMYRGWTRECMDWNVHNTQIMDRTNNWSLIANHRGALYTAAIFLDRPDEIVKYHKEWLEYFNKIKSEKFTAINLPSVNINTRAEQGDVGPSIEPWIESFLTFKLGNYHHRHIYAMIARIRLIQADRATDPEERQAALVKLEMALKDLKKEAKTDVHRCLYGALAAGYFRHLGQLDRARSSLEKAEIQAKNSGSGLGLFLIACERARFELAKNNPERAKMEAGLALQMCQKNGWKLRQVQVVQEFQLEDPKAIQKTAGPNEDVKLSISRSSRLKIGDRKVLDSLLQVSLKSALVIDPTEQAKICLDEVLKVMNGERAYLFLWDEATSSLVFKCGRGSESTELTTPTGYSTTVIHKVTETRQPLLVTGSDDLQNLASQSAVAHDLRSIMATPLVLKDQFKGVIYVDSRLAKGLFSAEDVEVLSAIANHIAISFESARLTRVEVQRGELAKDLELTAAVQQMFLPQPEQIEGPDYTMCGFYQPATQCSGDWWWHSENPNGNLSLIVGDVTGHGAAPAMITAAFAASIKMHERETLGKKSLMEVLSSANELLYDLAHETYLMSTVAMEFDFSERKLKLLTFGAPPILIFRKEGSVESISEMGTLLGIKSFKPGEIEVSFEPGDRIFVCTDGILEMKDATGKEITRRRFSRLLQQVRELPPLAATKMIYEELKQIRGNSPQEDDYTYVIVDIKSK